MTASDPWQDPTAKLWIQQVLSEMLPKLADSALVASIVPGDREGDVKFWVELGASIMLDKPIIAVVFEDRQVPAKLRAVADEIVVLPNGVDPAASEALTAAIRRVLGDDDAPTR